MKRAILLIFCLFVSRCLFAQLTTARTPEWSVSIKVQDEAGQPVVNAGVTIWYMLTNKLNGYTDANGLFKASHSDKSFALGIDVEKDGYYKFWRRYEMGWAYNYDKNTWNPSFDILLNRVVHPTPMYAKRVWKHLPENGNALGYDLMTGDWVAPFGKGTNADILFTKTSKKKAPGDYDEKTTVSFPNAGDGIQEIPYTFKTSEGSGLRSSHEAPSDGYKSQITRLSSSHPGQQAVFDYDDNRIYYFRVRTIVGGTGEVTSALYGKMYGDFVNFTYFLNPTPNDRNVEFDPKHNLVKGLKRFETIKAP